MTSRKRIQLRWSPLVRAVALCMITSATIIAVSPSPAFAVDEKVDVTHLFNASLSLTGNCSKSAFDGIEDPGCPGGSHPPEGRLVEPSGVTTDEFGNIYVVNRNPSLGVDSFHIDIFDASGNYLTNVSHKNARHVIVDPTGYLYVLSPSTSGNAIVRFDPVLYNPEAGEIAYDPSPVAVRDGLGVGPGMAVDPTNGHLYVHVNNARPGDLGVPTTRVTEYGPPTDGVPNEVLTDSIGEDDLQNSESPTGQIALDASRDRLYSVDWESRPGGKETVIRVFNLNSPNELLATFDGSTTPAGRFGTDWFRFELAVDEVTGRVFAGHIFQSKRIFVLDEDGEYLATIRSPALEGEYSWVGVDDGAHSPNQGFVYIPSGFATGRIQAYEPVFQPKPPLVESMSLTGVTEEEAVLHATINPEGEETHYAFEFTTQLDFEEKGFANAQLAGGGDIPLSGEGVDVSAPAVGLSPGTVYRFRVRAENQCEPEGCTDEDDSGFTTFAPYAQTEGCANEALRTGGSASLPDCRVYELVTPGKTNSRKPVASQGFPTWTGSPDGNSVGFVVQAGTIPGLGGAGGLNGDIYAAHRSARGWRSESAGLDGTNTIAQYPRGMSPDHSFVATDGTLAPTAGSSTIGAAQAAYLRYPDGTFHLVGEGSIGEDPRAGVVHITSGGGHVVFVADVQLEPGAPEDGVAAIYDRTSDGQLHVVSLPPDGVPSATGAAVEAVAADGSAVAFRLGPGSPIYLRVDNAETLEVAPSGAAFAGISEDGGRVLYSQGGDLYAFDVLSETSIPFTESGDAMPVYASDDGSTAFFLSKSVLGGGPNPSGDEPKAGERNLYASHEGTLAFIATVTEGDEKGEFRLEGGTGGFAGGFNGWLGATKSPATQRARGNADGSVLLFESYADLTDFASGGKKQIYRYDSDEGTLICLSCDRTQGMPSTDANLIDFRASAFPVSTTSIVPNLSRDGQRAFFESEERLVPADDDGLRDVYEWEAQGKGSCDEPGGCLFLISSGKSALPNYLYGASESGDDVFIITSDLLNGEDKEETPSIYDARVGGGFAPTQEAASECQGEACQPAANAPSDPTPASSSFEGKGNVGDEANAKARCPKGKRLARKPGRSRCVPRHGHKKRGKRAKTERRTHR